MNFCQWIMICVLCQMYKMSEDMQISVVKVCENHLIYKMVKILMFLITVNYLSTDKINATCAKILNKLKKY